MSRQNRSAGGDNFAVYMIVVIICVSSIFVLGTVLGNSNTFPDKGAGLPISNLNLSEDGLVVTFSSGSTGYRISLETPKDRPPSLSSANELSLDGDKIIFTLDGNVILTARHSSPITISEP